MRAKPFRLVQITDAHVFRRTDYRPWHLFSKRIMGGVNEFFFRRREHAIAVVDAALRAVAKMAPDHLLVTGDISSLSLEPELARFRERLEGLPLSSGQITVIPGNHDAYVPSALKDARFERVFDAYQISDDGFSDAPTPPQPAGLPPARYPIVRLRGPLALVACSTAHPAAPVLAVGTLGPAQLARIEAALTDRRATERFRLLALHHHPQLGAGKRTNRLTDAPALRALLRRVGADLVVHGHLHQDLRATLPGPGGPIPLRGTASVSCRRQDPLHRAQLRVFHLAEDRMLEEESWRYDPTVEAFAPE